MAITIRTHLGSHEITLLGKGGTGEVYRARDTKLNHSSLCLMCLFVAIYQA